MAMTAQQMSDALAQLQQQVQSVSARQNRESAFAPGSNDPYVVPGPRDFYSYTQRAPGLAAAGITALAFQIEADSFFYMNALSYTADVAAAALTESTNIIPLITIVLFDSGSGRQLMANPVPLPSIFGDGKRPFRLPKPRRFAPTAQITATLTNYSAATTYNVSLTLSGFKVYAPQQITSAGPIGS